MELDEFLEKDMLRFLEERKEKNTQDKIIDREEDYGLYLTKDYLKEVTSALESDEITKAQRLFDELRSYYETLPKGSLEAKKVYAILEQVYSKINAYNQLKGLTTNIRSFDDVLDRGFQGSIPQKIHQTTTKIDKKIDHIDEKITRFGEDFKELKKTIITGSQSNKVSLENVESKKPIYITASEIKISPPQNPSSSKIAEHSESNQKSKNILPAFNLDAESTHKTNNKVKDDSIEKFHLTKQAISHTEKPKSEKIIRIYKIPKNLKSRKNFSLKKDILDFNSSKKELFDKNLSEQKSSKSINEVEKTNTNKEKSMEKQDSKLKNTPNDVSKENKDFFDSPFKPLNKKEVTENSNMSIISQKNTQEKSKQKIENSSKKSGDTLNYEEKYYEALKLMQLKKYAEARKLFTEILSAKPNHKPSQIRLKQCQEAIVNVRK